MVPPPLMALAEGRICAICKEPEKLPFVDCAWSCSPKKCHNAHLKCMINFITQTGLATDLGDYQSTYYLRVGRCFVCKGGARASTIVSKQPMGWFQRLQLQADTRDTYVGLAEKHIGAGLKFHEECPGCGEAFTVPFRFYDHVQTCRNGLFIRMPCVLCKGDFPCDADLLRAFQAHRNSGSCRICKCYKCGGYFKKPLDAEQCHHSRVLLEQVLDKIATRPCLAHMLSDDIQNFSQLVDERIDAAANDETSDEANGEEDTDVILNDEDVA